MYLLRRPRYPGEAPTYAVCFDPSTSIFFALASAAGQVLSAVSAVQQGKAAQSQANLQASILQQQAESDRQKAAADEADFRKRQSRVLAARRAALGASGVEPASGSPLLVSEDFAAETELGALRVRAGGELRATRAEQQAVLQRFKGRQARSAGFARGGSLLVSGAGKVFS